METRTVDPRPLNIPAAGAPPAAALRNPFIRLDPQDNIVVARVEVPAGTFVESEGVATLHRVPAGHKIAVRGLKKGERILKHNTTIGFAGEDIEAGSWVHSHNIEFGDLVKGYRHGLDYRPTELLPPEQRARFLGIVRGDGSVATRNYVGVIAVSQRAAAVVRKICAAYGPERMAQYPQVDGVAPYTYTLGGDDRSGEEAASVLQRTLAGYARHVNHAAVLLVSYGDERQGMESLLRNQALEPSATLRTLVVREAGGISAAVEQGVQAVQGMLAAANQVQRASVSAEHIVVGLQCGGSDGFSGLSANPALGRAMELLIRNGGTAVLSETSEIFGVEQTLTARARTPDIGRKLVRRIEWWLEYNRGRDTQINGQVSPGNNAGGLANVLEKSLGGVKKGGNAPLMEVYEYAEPIEEHGLVFMDTPGYDPVAATGQIAGGANLVCFTTGRGSCYGSFPAPTIKLASNTPMFVRMEADMDINCGPVIDGDMDIEAMGQQIFARILDHASGAATKSEALGVGSNEFVPWPVGVMR